MGYEPEEYPSEFEPMPGFDARLFWDVSMWYEHSSPTRLPTMSMLDLVRNNEQFATAYAPDLYEKFYAVYWNKIPDWVATDAVDPLIDSGGVKRTN